MGSPSPPGPPDEGSRKRPKTKPANRRNPEARREQNRIASRNYRLKRKQKLALLDQLADGDKASRAAGSPSTPSLTTDDVHFLYEVCNLTNLPRGFRMPAFGELLVGYATHQANLARQSTSLANVLTNHGWSNTVEPSSTEEDSPYTGSLEAPAYPFSTLSYSDHPPPPSTSSPQFTPTPSSPKEDDDDVTRVLQDVRSLSHDQKLSLIRHIRHDMGLGAVSETSTPAHSTSHPQLPPYVSCADVSRKWHISNARKGKSNDSVRNEALRFALLIDYYLHGDSSPLGLHRTFDRDAALFGALFSNCYAIGMTGIDELMLDEGTSPFCLGPNTGYQPNQLPMIRGRFINITTDMKPCDLQLTHGHHPYLDVIPFLSFRENTLEYQKANPTFDEDELCRDIIIGGLVFRGSQTDVLDMRACVPWDTRSWEPQVWFLRKYRSLVGGWDGDMWRAARRWHEARGEPISVREVPMTERAETESSHAW